MREGRWRWWRDQGSQRKRSLHAWMRWDKHSDILNLEPCDVCKEWVWQRKTTKTNNYTHIHVFTKCVTSLSGFMCFVLILVFTLSLVSDVSPFSKKVWYVNFISPRILNFPSTKFFSSGCCSPTLSCHRQLNLYPKSCIFHIAKTGLLRCCLYTSRRVQ